MNKAIKYRLYPTTKQMELFNKTFGCCRKVYNLMLADKISHYNTYGTNLSVNPATYKNDYPYLREVDSLALTSVWVHLNTAYNNFFRDKKVGFPKYKSAKRSRKSYTTNNQKGTIEVLDNKIKLPKVKYVKAKIHRLPNEDWVIKSATISKESDGNYYCSVLFEYDKLIKEVIPSVDKVLGLDYKSSGLYHDSNNKVCGMPPYYRLSHKKLAKEQRKLKHKAIGSKNYYKQQSKIGKIHKHISNQRLDFLHKTSTEIANSYDAISVEDLNMKAMSNKGFGNGKATLDNGYGMFLNLLDYKLKDRGKKLIKVDKYFPSSQLCSCCGYKQKLKLTDRIYNCPSCGLSIDRDYNASINIRNEGIRLLSIT